MRGIGRSRTALMVLIAGILLTLTAVVPTAPTYADAACESEAEACDAPEAVEGKLVVVASSIRREPDGLAAPPAISLLLDTGDGLLSVTLARDARVIETDGEIVTPTSIALGTRLLVQGQRLSPSQFEATAITVLP